MESIFRPQGKPIWRWTLGPVSDQGFYILKESVKKIKQTYGTTFQYVVCWNGLTPKQLDQLKQIKVDLFQQMPDSLPYPPKNEMWKLYPPRLDMNVHEIVVDNDIVIFDKIPIIDQFLESNFNLLYEGLHRSLGSYDRYVPPGLRINSGIYGVPPGFDLKAGILHLLSNDKTPGWKDRFDDQGIIAHVLTKNGNFQILRQSTVPILEPQMVAPKTGCQGMHFVFANRMESQPWNQYKLRKCLF
jgi:hypothetical protein